MHTINGGWVGQTFALANCNESGGKKSRIRRSKEERKGMVESFIKKYQSLNAGNFPSLNLTHKEVGGSFYTVREIVREIIQENRVLGPGKLLLEEQHDDQLLEQYPLGAIAKEPQTSVPELSKGCPSLSDQHDSSSEALGLISEQLVESEQQGFDNDKIINGSHAIVKGEDAVKPKVAEVQVTEPLPAEKRVEAGAVSRAKVAQTEDVIVAEVQVAESLETEKNVEAVAVPRAEVTQIEEVIVAEIQVTKSLETEKRVEGVVAARAKVTQMEDVIVETFPLPAVTKTAGNLNRNSGEARKINGTFEENDVDKVRLVPGHDPGYSISQPERINSLDGGSLVDDEVGKPAGTLFGKNSDLVDEKAVENLFMRSSNASIIKEGIERGTKVAVDVKVPSTHDDKAIAETKVVDAPKDIQAKSPDGNYATVGSRQSINEEVIKDKALAQHGGGSPTESSPTLDRIHLESWGGVSKSPARSETNPLMAILKSFVAAFLKFLSE